MDIEKVYKNYGFEVKNEDIEIKTFLYKKGRYFGVDIIPLTDTHEIKVKTKVIQEKYSKLGYAVNIKSFKTEDEIEVELFKSFFAYDSTINRLNKKYTEFKNRQVKNLLGNKYVYIHTPFELYDGDDNETGSNLLDSIESIINKESPQLIIIEAAAGYGKTCAVYEILNRLISQNEKVITPLFTELAKNRGANIFRYILLDEIDVEFPTLNSELVINEIKNGRIPLIIDGFDELLEKVNVTNVEISNAFDEIETMLDTIGNLLENNSKIILTTRKTAIFSGLEFDKWFQKWNEKFKVTRFSLKEPKIKDWLGSERFRIVKDNNVPIQYVANPVILTYLRNTSNDDFFNLISNPDILINSYFNWMLEREKERQNLIITVDKQYEIFKNVAKMLVEFDITIESKEFFKEIIKDQNFKLLEYTRTLYTGNNKPSIENLVDTLATHALLDRKGRDESKIGFINDFVFGILIGELICESSIEKIENDFSFYMLDLACTAYKVQNKKNKSILWEKVNNVKHKLQPISLFNYDISLKEGLARDYFSLTIYDITIFNITFSNNCIDNTVFLNCKFKNCFFDPSIFKGVSFVDCTFSNCSVKDDIYLDSSKEISIIKSKLIDCQILENYIYPSYEEFHIFNELEMDVLRKIWLISGSKSHHVMQVLQAFEKNKNKQVGRTLQGLEAREFIQIRGSHINFNINKLQIIKIELGLIKNMYQPRDLERICRNTVSIIDDELSRVGIFFRVFSRVKTSHSTLDKINCKGANYYDGELKFVRDIIGIRIILYFSDDVLIIKRSLSDSFELVEQTIDENEETKFAPTRINLIFRLPNDLIKEFSDLTKNKIFDSTFEVQLRTILSEGWHEVDHDLRYKCTDDWKENSDLARNFNGILAAIETSEYTILRLFEQLSFRHYKAKNIRAMLRTKFRLRFIDDKISFKLQEALTDEFIREIYKLERIEVLNFIYKSKWLLPLTMETFIFLLNFNFIKNDMILGITPNDILQELNN